MYDMCTWSQLSNDKKSPLGYGDTTDSVGKSDLHAATFPSLGSRCFFATLFTSAQGPPIQQRISGLSSERQRAPKHENDHTVASPVDFIQCVEAYTWKTLHYILLRTHTKWNTFIFFTMWRCGDILLAIQCKQLLKQEQSMWGNVEQTWHLSNWT